MLIVVTGVVLLQLKVVKSEEQPVVSVDSRKFAIDSSFQPSTVSGMLSCQLCI